MKILKLFIFVILSFGLLESGAAAQTKRGKNVKKPNKTPVVTAKHQKIGETKPPELYGCS